MLCRVRLDSKVAKASLAKGTVAAIKENEAVLAAHLSHRLPLLEDWLLGLKGVPASALQKAFQETQTIWLRYFWAMVAQHWLLKDQGLEEAIRLAETDLLEAINLVHAASDAPTMPGAQAEGKTIKSEAPTLTSRTGRQVIQSALTSASSKTPVPSQSSPGDSLG